MICFDKLCEFIPRYKELLKEDSVGNNDILRNEAEDKMKNAEKFQRYTRVSFEKEFVDLIEESNDLIIKYVKNKVEEELDGKNINFKEVIKYTPQPID